MIFIKKDLGIFYITLLYSKMDNETLDKNAKLFECKHCDFKCSKHSNFSKHISTAKHKRVINGNLMVTENAVQFTCDKCSKTYKHKSGLCRHNKKCQYTSTIPLVLADSTPSENIIISTNPTTILSKYEQHEKDITQLTHLVIEVVKNNSELQKQMLDMCKNMQSTMINSNNNSHNTTNNSFNLQVFLNEHCKDAMNISEFIDSFDLQLSDLENVGRQGYIEGMSTIIINKIKDMDVNKRPLHCSDLKREIVYIKDDDVWEREDANNTKFRKVIGKVMRKNIGMLTGWRDKYPDCMDIESEYNDIYVRLTKEAMGPDDTIDSENKIIKRVLKHIVIDKKAIAACN